MTCAPPLQRHRRGIALLMLLAMVVLTVAARPCLAMAALDMAALPEHGDCAAGDAYCPVVCQLLEADRHANPQPPVLPQAPPWLPPAPPPQVLPLALPALSGPALSPVASPLPGLWPTLRCRVLLI